MFIGNTEEFESLMKNNGNVNTRDKDNNTPLILAAENGNSRNSIKVHPTNIFKQTFLSFR